MNPLFIPKCQHDFVMTISNTALPKGEISVMRAVRKRKRASGWLAGIKTADFRLLHLVD